jgi:hypothetical protein
MSDVPQRLLSYAEQTRRERNALEDMGCRIGNPTLDLIAAAACLSLRRPEYVDYGWREVCGLSSSPFLQSIWGS